MTAVVSSDPLLPPDPRTYDLGVAMSPADRDPTAHPIEERRDPRDGAPSAGTVDTAEQPHTRGRIGLEHIGSPEMRYQSAYVWLIFVSSLDIMLTWAILRRGGEEVNPVARQVIDLWGLHGAIVFKFALMLFVIVSCEVIGRQRDRAGRRLAYIAVGISAVPVIYSFSLLVDHILLRPPPV
jgi:Domain of unknown function (DUF5658)